MINDQIADATGNIFVGLLILIFILWVMREVIKHMVDVVIMKKYEGYDFDKLIEKKYKDWP